MLLFVMEYRALMENFVMPWILFQWDADPAAAAAEVIVVVVVGLYYYTLQMYQILYSNL